MQEEIQSLSPEQIDKHYLSALDSVALINGPKPDWESEEDRKDSIRRNVEHLKIMISKDFMQAKNLSPIADAIVLGESLLK